MAWLRKDARRQRSLPSFRLSGQAGEEIGLHFHGFHGAGQGLHRRRDLVVPNALPPAICLVNSLNTRESVERGRRLC